MKIIERRKNQAIVIDNHIRVTILEVHDDEITVSIESQSDPEMNRIETLFMSAGAGELALAGSVA